MTPISETLHELLVRQGIAQERTAIRQAQEMNAGAPEGTAHPLAAQLGEYQEPMGILVKGAPTEIGAKFTGGGKRQHRLGRNETVQGGITFRVFVNPALDTTPKHGLAHAPRVAPLGASPCLRVIEGGKR